MNKKPSLGKNKSAKVLNAMLQIRDPALFWPRDPSWVFSGSRIPDPNPYFWELLTILWSVADPDPDPPNAHVFGPPESGSGSISQRYGSGSFYHQAKPVRKTLIPTAMWLLFDFLSLKISVADTDPGSGAFLTLDPVPGSGIGFSWIPDLGSRIPDPNPIFFRA